MYSVVSFRCTAICYTYIHSFRCFFHIGHYRVLSRVPCVIQQVLISSLFHISVQSLSCLTLCDPMNCSTPGLYSYVYVSPNLSIYPSRYSPVCVGVGVGVGVWVCGCVGVWVCVRAQLLSCVCLFVTPWTGAHQAPLSMKFSRQEYWRGQLFASPGDLPDLGSNPGLLHCRQIPYHRSHQGSPNDRIDNAFTLSFLFLPTGLQG